MANQKQTFYLNGLPKCKAYLASSVMIFMLYVGFEKVVQTFSLNSWALGLLRWWVLGVGIAFALASIISFALHKKLALINVDDEGITCFWGMSWNRRQVEIVWEKIKSADISWIHKQRVVRLSWMRVPTDLGSEEKVIKIALNEPVVSDLAGQIDAVMNQWWGGSIEANKAENELYLRAEPYGGFDPLWRLIKNKLD